MEIPSLKGSVELGSGVFRQYHTGNNPVNMAGPEGLTAVAIGKWWPPWPK